MDRISILEDTPNDDESREYYAVIPKDPSHDALLTIRGWLDSKISKVAPPTMEDRVESMRGTTRRKTETSDER